MAAFLKDIENIKDIEDIENIEDIKKKFNKETYEKLVYLTNKIGIYFNYDYPTELVPYLALLVLPLKKLENMAPKRPIEPTPYAIDHGYITHSLDKSKEGYILAIAYQAILDKDYKGLEGKYVKDLTKWLIKNGEDQPEKDEHFEKNTKKGNFNLENYDVGAIVNNLIFFYPSIERSFSIEDLEYALGLFRGDKKFHS